MAPLSQQITEAGTGDAIVDQGAAGSSAWPVKSATSTTATPANIPSANTTTVLLALNTSRLAWSVFNDSTSIAYINFGASASASAYVIRLQPNSYYESNPGINFTGALNIIWVSANGNARVCEFTA